MSKTISIPLMIKNLLIVTLFFLLNLNLSIAQNVSVEQLISLRPKSPSEIEEFLTSKNWEIFKGAGNEWDLLFSYNKSKFEEKAEAFIKIKFGETNALNKVQIQVASVTKYNFNLNRIKELGYKISSSLTLNGGIIKHYKKNNLYITIETTSTLTDEMSSLTNAHYFFTIYTMPKIEENEPINIEENTTTENDNSIDPAITKCRDFIYKNILESNFQDGIFWTNQLQDLIDLESSDFYNLGLCYFGLEDYPKSIENFKLAEQDFQKDFDFLRIYANSLAFNQQYTQSIKYYLKIIKNKEITFEDYSNLGFNYLMTKQYGQSIIYYKKAVLEKNISSQIDYLTILALSKKTEEAKNTLKKIVALGINENININDLLKIKIDSLKFYNINVDNLIKIISSLKI